MNTPGLRVALLFIKCSRFFFRQLFHSSSFVNGYFFNIEFLFPYRKIALLYLRIWVQISVKRGCIFSLILLFWFSLPCFHFLPSLWSLFFTACLFFPFIGNKQLLSSKPVISVKRHLKPLTFTFTLSVTNTHPSDIYAFFNVRSQSVSFLTETYSMRMWLVKLTQLLPFIWNGLLNNWCALCFY